MYRATSGQAEIEQLYRSLNTTDTTNAVSVILKVRGETCDIDCLYCYEKRKEAPGGTRIEPGQVRQLADLFPRRPLAVELHGGEPLTAGRDHLAELLAELAAQPSVIRVSLQTNGVLLDDQWLDLFDQLYPGLQIGISLDGDAQGNAWRVGYDGSPIYPRITAALRLLAARGRTAGVIAAVTPAILGRAEAVLDHLAGFDAINAVSFVPCFDTSIRRATASAGRRAPASRVLQQANLAGASGPGWAIHPDDYAEFVLAATARWVAAGHFVNLKLEPAVSTIRRLQGLDTGFCHFSDLKCDHVFTLYPDGRLGSCDELPWPQAQLTNLAQNPGPNDVIRAQKQSLLLNQGKSLMERCVTCDYQATCGGGCIATRWRYDQISDQDAYCDYRMRMIDGIAALLAQPADPAGIWCRTLRWRPRNPNTMSDVDGFLRRWDDPTAPRQPVDLRVSEYGNINVHGLPGLQEADDLDPTHPQWPNAIEPGVRPLIAAFTENWGLVTYDSCTGHAYPGLTVPAAECRIGILPRTPHEYATTAAALCQVAAIAGPNLPLPVTMLIGRSNLTCETTGHVASTIDLRFQPAQGHGWDAYFTNLGDAISVVRSATDQVCPSTVAACACTGPSVSGVPSPNGPPT